MVGICLFVKGAALEEEGSAQKRSKSRKRKREDSDNHLVKELEPSEHSPTKKHKKRKKKKEVPQSVSSESVQQQTSQVKKKTTNVPKVRSLDYDTLCDEPHNTSHHGYSVTDLTECFTVFIVEETETERRN